MSSMSPSSMRPDQDGVDHNVSSADDAADVEDAALFQRSELTRQLFEKQEQRLRTGNYTVDKHKTAVGYTSGKSQLHVRDLRWLAQDRADRKASQPWIGNATETFSDESGYVAPARNEYRYSGIPKNPFSRGHPTKPLSFRKLPLNQASSKPRNSTSETLDASDDPEEIDPNLRALKALYETIKGGEDDWSTLSCTSDFNASTNCVSGRELDGLVTPSISSLTPLKNVAQDLYAALLPWEARLLAIHPADSHYALTTDLLTVILTDDSSGLGSVSEKRLIEYEALSYTWGEPNSTHFLSCNSLRIPITPNLNEALKHLRLKDKKRYIWVDQLCINQSDIVEKAIQISKLFQVFQRASRVVVWLGQATEPLSQAAEYIKMFVTAASAIEGTESAAGMVTRFLPAFIATSGGCSDALLTGMVRLFQRSWFRRAWCLQEIFAAKAITLHRGNIEMSWLDILVAKESLVRPLLTSHLIGHPLPPELISKGNVDLQTIHKTISDLGGIATVSLMEDLRSQAYRRRLSNASESNALARRLAGGATDTLLARLFDMLTRATHLMATDDRDRIFALLGIAKELGTRRLVTPTDDPDTDFIEVNYTQTTSQLYQEVTKRMINEFHSLEPIYGKDFSSNDLDSDVPTHIGDLPSWSPDWRKYSLAENFCRRFDKVKAHLSTAQSLMQTKQYVLQNLNSTGRLTLTGITIGTVVSVGESFRKISMMMRLNSGDSTFTRPIVEPSDGEEWGCTIEHTNNFELTKFRSSPESALRYLHSHDNTSQWRGVGYPLADDRLVVVFGGLTRLILRRRRYLRHRQYTDLGYRLVGHACVFQKASRLQPDYITEEHWLGSSLEARLFEILHDGGSQGHLSLQLAEYDLT